MALKWALSSVYNIVVGHAADATPEACNSKIKFPNGKTEQVSNHGLVNQGGEYRKEKSCVSGFQMPLHYPRYRKADYEKMEEWKLDMLLKEYGLNFNGSLEEKRVFAMGAFLWPDEL